jgi:hypothetical protein
VPVTALESKKSRTTSDTSGNHTRGYTVVITIAADQETQESTQVDLAKAADAGEGSSRACLDTAVISIAAAEESRQVGSLLRQMLLARKARGSVWSRLQIQKPLATNGVECSLV